MELPMLSLLSRHSRRRLHPACAAIAALSLSGMGALAEVQLGKPAPDFAGKDTNGTVHALANLKGKTVVLEWTNHECPYTVKHYATGNMQALQQEAAGKGVVWLTVASSAPGKQGYVTAAQANKLTAERQAVPAAVLLDPDGRIGRLYDARTTPHMFVIDKDGKVAYMGAIDDTPTANHADVKTARNYVRDALAALAAGKPVPTTATRPYGCTVKYGPRQS